MKEPIYRFSASWGTKRDWRRLWLKKKPMWHPLGSGYVVHWQDQAYDAGTGKRMEGTHD